MDKQFNENRTDYVNMPKEELEWLCMVKDLQLREQEIFVKDVFGDVYRNNEKFRILYNHSSIFHRFIDSLMLNRVRKETLLNLLTDIFSYYDEIEKKRDQEVLDKLLYEVPKIYIKKEDMSKN